MKSQYNYRIQAVRNEMAKLDLDAFVVPHEDEYLLEEVSDCNNRLKWISGFTGTAGVAVVLKDDVIFFVDGRYSVQVTKQVDGELFSFESMAVFESNSWIDSLLPPSAKIGIDSSLHSFDWFSKFISKVAIEGRKSLPLKNNLIDLCWTNRPTKISTNVKLIDEKYCGKSSITKCKEVAGVLCKAGVDRLIITNLESTCWLLNLRGSDIPCLPVFYSTSIIDQNAEVICFLDLTTLDEKLKSSFKHNVSFKCITQLDEYLLSISNCVTQIDPKVINAHMARLLQKPDVNVIQSSDPIGLLKAQKNPIEITGMKACHIRDGAALINFLSWLDLQVREQTFYDEAQLADKLETFRTVDELYQEPSFDTVSAVGSNGAMCHYNHKDTIAKLMTNNTIYLVDSGAHYLDGTTDVTRTVAIGKATKEQIKMATLVLKGHISLATIRFPFGTTGQQLDAFARQHLWQKGYDYEHGTGHGVGHYLNVHEGPQRIAKANSNVALLPGMVVSIEPGYYRQDEFGIRHENLYVVKESLNISGSDINMLCFEVLTHVPFDRRLIDKAELTKCEIEWLNTYHEMVYRLISPLIDTRSNAWLLKETTAL
ncbi:aminopeptidase P family protein [Pseudoalteromonas sp. NGC95]|uniref:aminopeptidase P family protein n=1 Tax=Pseudoalteromonas sp. NGC95 TaxID=2792051 RepID=UPI0018CECFBC|nr:aminopeptidase P family protein [Pseudoalteromonas sp. NGC95]MBH0017116.1 aminopeptidase P family protein [Pseudoalteromonas sp. NGC95]